MAKENVPTPAPTRSDKQILLAFTASANVPTIYIQQFWNTLTQDAKSGVTPKDSAHPFVSPLASEQVIDFMNELGYPEEIHFVSKMHVNNLYQPWRAIMSLINQCLMAMTNPGTLFYKCCRVLSLKPMLTVLNFCGKSLYKRFRFSSLYQANLNNPTKKSTPHVIPYCRLTKLIIYYLGSRHNIHRRPESAIHVTGDEFLLGNLKFVPKGEKDEVFGKLIPNVLITDAIRNSEYYQQYTEM
ncbi:hypothetical protein Tco_1288581, partial [Tanacetum coccineum]